MYPRVLRTCHEVHPKKREKRKGKKYSIAANCSNTKISVKNVRFANVKNTFLLKFFLKKLYLYHTTILPYFFSFLVSFSLTLINIKGINITFCSSVGVRANANLRQTF